MSRSTTVNLASFFRTNRLMGDWVLDAECARHDPEIFFGTSKADEMAAKTICRRCPVEAECLQWGVTKKEEYGVWGGASVRERRDLRSRRACRRCGKIFHAQKRIYCSEQCRRAGRREVLRANREEAAS